MYYFVIMCSDNINGFLSNKFCIGKENPPYTHLRCKNGYSSFPMGGYNKQRYGQPSKHLKNI